MNKILLLLTTLFASINLLSQTITIEQARTLAEGTTVTVKGLVLNGSELGKIRYIQDQTSAVALYDANSLTDVKVGDSITATGKIKNYNNLIEIETIGTNFTIHNSNNPLPEPVTLQAGSLFTEDYEARLVRLPNMYFISPAGNFAGNTNYDLSDGIGTYQMRVVNTTNIAGTPIPADYLNIVGIMSQYTNTYQILPRSLTDIEFLGNPPVFSSSLTQTDITTTSFKVSFTTLNPGSTLIKYGKTQALELGTLTDNTLTTNHTTSITGLEAGNIYYVQAQSISATNDISSSSIQPMATVSLSSGTIKAYFNRTVDNSLSTGVNAIYLNQQFDDTLKAYIARAKYSIDMCIYSFDNDNQLIEALQAAANKGVITRFVFESGVSNAYVTALPGNNKSVRPSDLNGIMHNKFIVIDANSTNPNDPIVWTGSTNFTDNQLKVDANNVVIFQDQTLARAYTMEFEEMLFGKFSNEKKDNTPHEFLIGGKRVESYFSPSDQVNAAIQRTAQYADTDLSFAVLAFTRTDIAYKITGQKFDNVKIRGILDDNSEPNQATIWDILTSELGTADIKEDNGGYIMHHKYMIADATNPQSDPCVLTGSHNWSNAAQFNNDENTVIIHDATIANLFFQEFGKRFADVGGAIGVNDVLNNTNLISLHPNPAQQQITISYNGILNGKQNLRITNMVGQVVYQATISQKITPINLSNLTKGMYIATIDNISKKLIITQ